MCALPIMCSWLRVGHCARRPRVDLLEDQVQEQHVHLLDPRRRVGRDDEREVGVLGGRPAAPPPKSTVVAPELARGREAAHDVRRPAARREADDDVARRARSARTWRSNTSSNA